MQHDSLWDKTRIELIERLDRDTYERYLAGVVPLSYSNEKGLFVLGTQNDLLTMWLESNYGALIAEIVGEILSCRVAVHFQKYVAETDGAIAVPANEPRAQSPAPVRKAAARPRGGPKTKPSTRRAPSTKSAAAEPEERTIRPDYTFDSFVVGDNARTAFAAATAVSDNPGRVYNPLFLYGRVGLGKTHLLQAIGNTLYDRRKRAKVCYLTSEEFVNRYVEALQAGTLTKFRRQMRSLDMLLIDDIQFLEGKVSSSEEFFHTFNALHNAHKQIVFTADRTPAQLNGLDDRMVSRFGGGLHEELHAPDFETRAAILRTKQEHHKKKLSDDVIYLIARRVRSNIRNLESALTKLVMNMTAFGGEMTVTRAEELLADKFDAEVAQQVNIATIQKQVASYFEIRLGEMLSVKRPRNIAEPRMVAMYLSRQMTDQSLPAIGKSFERNHATVIHAIDRIENKMAKDENFRSIVNQLERQLRS